MRIRTVGLAGILLSLAVSAMADEPVSVQSRPSAQANHHLTDRVPVSDRVTPPVIRSSDARDVPAPEFADQGLVVTAGSIPVTAAPLVAAPHEASPTRLRSGDWKPIGQLGLRVAPPAGDLPAPTPARPSWYSDEERVQGVGGSRAATQTALGDATLTLTPSIEVNWQPTELWYRPLYFEDANLERYGYRYGVAQPAVSAAHFFGRVPFIPYLRGAQPARGEVAALGPRRPGSPDMVPTRASFVPSPRGALYQAGATVGGAFIVP